jgi:hypothetical protein
MINLLLMIFFWASSSFSLYLLTYSLKNISGNFFLNNLISGISEIPVAIFGGWVYHKYGLRIVLTIFFSAAMAGGIAIIIFSETNPKLVPIMVSFAKGGVKVTFEICYLGNSFLFPAIFAGTAFGLCNAGAKISTILSPLLAEATPPFPMILFSILTGMGAVFPIFLRKGPNGYHQ